MKGGRGSSINPCGACTFVRTCRTRRGGRRERSGQDPWQEKSKTAS